MSIGVYYFKHFLMWYQSWFYLNWHLNNFSLYSISFLRTPRCWMTGNDSVYDEDDDDDNNPKWQAGRGGLPSTRCRGEFPCPGAEWCTRGDYCAETSSVQYTCTDKMPISAIFCSKRHVFQLHDNHLWIRGPSAAGHPLHALLLPPQSGKYDTLVLKRNLIAWMFSSGTHLSWNINYDTLVLKH